MNVQFLGVEAGFAGALDGLIEFAETGEGEEMLGYVMLDPSGSAQSVKWVAR